MIKNICIISSVIFCMALTSCTMSLSAVNGEQKFNATVSIYEIPVVDCKK